MDKKKFIEQVQDEVQNLDLEDLQERLNAKIAEKPHGRQERDAKEWTIKALREVLESKRKAHNKQEVVHQARLQEEESRKQERQGAKDMIVSAFQYLQRIFQNDKWIVSDLNTDAFPTKASLLQAMEMSIIIDDTGSMSVFDSGQENQKPIYMNPRPMECLPNSLGIYMNTNTNVVSGTINVAPRTEEWSAVEASGKIAFAQHIVSHLSLEDGQNNILQKAIAVDVAVQDANVAGGVLYEIGQKAFIDAINNIQASIPDSAKESAEAYWRYIIQEWPSIQSCLDDTITMLPPRSRQEAIERIYRYLFVLKRTQNYGFDLNKITLQQIEGVADAMFRSIPQSIDAETATAKHAHYDPELLKNPAITLAREGKEIIFIAPRASFDTAPLRDSDLQISLTHNTLWTKQRVAALVPAYDKKTYNPDEWVSGKLLYPEELTVRRTKHQYVDGVRAIQSKLGGIMPNGLDTDLVNARWFLDKPGAVFQQRDALECRVVPKKTVVGEHNTWLEIHTTPGNAPWITFTNDEAHPLWRGIAVFNALSSHSYERNPRRILNAGYEKIAQLHPESSLWLRIVEIQKLQQTLTHLSSTKTPPQDTSDPLAQKMMSIREGMKVIDRSITRVPAKSIPELMTRFALASTIFSRNDTTPLIANFPYQQHAKDVLWESIPRPITPSSDAELGTLMDTLGIDTSEQNMYFVREGSQKMSFVCRREYMPVHPLFHRSHEQDEEKILDLVVAVDESLDQTIEKERGQWVSGTLPTVKELEERYLTSTDVPNEGVQQIVSDGGKKGTKEDSASNEDTTERVEVEYEHNKIRSIRNVLLQLSVEGKLSQKAEYAYDIGKDKEVSYERGAGTHGLTVIKVPDADVTFVIAPDKKTRVILNAQMSSDTFKNMTVEAIDQDYGKRDITYSDQEQFEKNIRSWVETRLDPKQRSVNYPVGSDKNPSPLRTFPSDPSKDFLLAIFRRISEVCHDKALATITLGDIRGIESGQQWPLGSSTHGHTLLMNIWRELPRETIEALTLNSTIEDEDYRKLRGLFDYLKPIIIEHFNKTEPAEGRIDSTRSDTSVAIQNTSGESSTT